MALKQIIPKVSFNQQKINQELVKGMDKYTKLVSKEFEETVQTWNEKPSFTRTVVTSGNNIIGEVSTKNKIYIFVSDGTNRHWVGPKNASRLRFRSGYNAKTSQGRIPSVSGGATGSVVFSRGHYVSGIKARKFDTQIKNDTESRFKDYMLNAFEDAILEV